MLNEFQYDVFPSHNSKDKVVDYCIAQPHSRCGDYGFDQNNLIAEEAGNRQIASKTNIRLGT